MVDDIPYAGIPGDAILAGKPSPLNVGTLSLPGAKRPPFKSWITSQRDLFPLKSWGKI